MAKMVEITPQQWAKYEAGADMPGSEPLTRLCLEFDLSADILLGISKKGRENIPVIE